MDVTAIPSHVSASNVPLDELANNRTLTHQQKVAKVAQQFEAVMLQQILQEMQKPVFKTEFTDNSTAASIYRSLISKQFGEAISQSGEFGLAKMLEQQLGKEIKAASTGQEQSPVTTAIAPAAANTATALNQTKEPFQFTAIQSK